MRAFALSLLPAALLLAAPTAISAQQATPAPARTDTDTARLQAHYAAVERELRAADTTGLSAAQRAARDSVIEALRQYRERGDFGINTDFPGERMPYFVDHEGRRCAVGNLLDRTGHGDLTLEIARTANHLWVAELEGDPRFAQWLDEVGLTFAEAARIQGPGRDSIRRWAPQTPVAITPPAAWDTPAPTTPGPADAAVPAPRSPTGPRGAVPGPTTPRGSAAGQPTVGPRTGVRVALDEIGWNVWWRWNRRAFLRPNRLTGRVGPITGPGSGDDDGSGFRAHARRSILPFLRERIRDEDARIRGAAAITLARIDGAEAVPDLLGLLDDPSIAVRNDAILALGATGSSQATHALLHIAHRGTSPRADRETISSLARPLALVALGLVHRNDRDVQGRAASRRGPRVASVIPEILRRVQGAERERMATAAMMAHTIAPSDTLEQLGVGLIRNTEEGAALRCRALEALDRSADAQDLAMMIRALSGVQRDVRRSAAVALGAVANRNALQPLQTAFELEAEVLTRAFILLAIGRRGDAEAEGFLLRTMQKGRKALRPWAALALGLLGREQRSPAALRAVREGYLRENNRDARGAYLIASGLMRDGGAVTQLVDVLSSSKNATLRVYAAESLAMIGGDAARRALRRQLERDSCSETRVFLAEVLGYIGSPEDTELLRRTADESNNPMQKAGYVLALGYLGSLGAFETVRELATAKAGKESVEVRATAIDALGMMIGEHDAFVLAELGQRANYTMFPPWLAGAARLTL
jgi:HEAT repeat protein